MSERQAGVGVRQGRVVEDIIARERLSRWHLRELRREGVQDYGVSYSKGWFRLSVFSADDT